MRQGLKTTESNIAAITSLTALVPSGPMSGKSPFAKDAPAVIAMRETKRAAMATRILQRHSNPNPREGARFAAELEAGRRLH